MKKNGCSIFSVLFFSFFLVFSIGLNASDEIQPSSEQSPRAKMVSVNAVKYIFHHNLDLLSRNIDPSMVLSDNEVTPRSRESLSAYFKNVLLKRCVTIDRFKGLERRIKKIELQIEEARKKILCFLSENGDDAGLDDLDMFHTPFRHVSLMNLIRELNKRNMKMFHRLKNERTIIWNILNSQRRVLCDFLEVKKIPVDAEAFRALLQSSFDCRLQKKLQQAVFHEKSHMTALQTEGEQEGEGAENCHSSKSWCTYF